MNQPQNFEFWNNSEFFFALDLSQTGKCVDYNEIVKFLLDYRDIHQLGCWRILYRNTAGEWYELTHNGSVFTQLIDINKTEWVWTLLNAVD